MSSATENLLRLRVYEYGQNYRYKQWITSTNFLYNKNVNADIEYELDILNKWYRSPIFTKIIIDGKKEEIN